jgi:hypothetical protein
MGYRWVVFAGLSVAAGCGSGGSTSMSADGGPNGVCSANVPAGEACNTLADVGTPVTPSCATGTIPAGTGGTIVDGTYTLTSQTYYGVTGCPSEPVTGTIEIAGGCIQSVDSLPIPVTGAQTYTVAGASITVTPTCIDVGIDAGGLTVDFLTKTFTATPTTFTVFTKNSGTSSPNPDRVESYAKR